MNKEKNICLMACFGYVLGLAAGCGGQRQYEAAEPVCKERIEKLQAMEITKDVLIKMHFVIEKADEQKGYIRTKPLAGAQFFELWRSDNVGLFNWAEANLHSLQRIAEVNINSVDGQICIDCKVKVRRLSLPQREVTDSTQMAGLFTVSSSRLQKLRLSGRQRRGAAWVDLGIGPRLGAEILNRIEEEITKLKKGQSQ